MTGVRELADEPFVSLTTFRRSGEAVATPLWVVRDDERAAFWTPRGSGKVKRLRNNPAVELRPCSRRGAVEHGAPIVHGRAEISANRPDLDRVERALRSKYGLQMRLVSWVERLRPGLRDRVVILVTDASD